MKNRAHGYDAGRAGLLRAAYLDHTWPYAAGSLCSTVNDLIAWNLALHGGRLLSAASYRELITAGTLNDGTRLRYGGEQFDLNGPRLTFVRESGRVTRARFEGGTTYSTLTRK